MVFDLVLACVHYVMAGLIWHRAVPACLMHGESRAVKLWALGMAHALFGSGRVLGWLGSFDGPAVYDYGHAFLIGYSLALYLQIRRAAPGAAWSDHF